MKLFSKGQVQSAGVRLYYGGSFNPIHHGHLICGRAAAETSGFTGVVLVPTAHPPHKFESATLADSAHRLAMTQAAVAGDAFFTVDPIELSRRGPSYTLDTARELAARDRAAVHWMIGADMLLYLPKWHRIDELIEEVTFLIVARPGWSLDWTQLPPKFRPLAANVVAAPEIRLSATQIRARVAAGRSIRYLVPDTVDRYIQQHRLYREAPTDATER